jgi:hypothetical protein
MAQRINQKNINPLNFIGGEKSGVGKSIVSRVLAQYFIDKERPFLGFETDRSHTSFTRFYTDFASPVIVDSDEGLDMIASAFEQVADDDQPRSVIVDLAAQTLDQGFRCIHRAGKNGRDRQFLACC